MKPLHSTYPTACSRYRKSTAHLLEVNSADPERLDWERHAMSCPVCAAVIEADQELRGVLTHLDQPHPVRLGAAIRARMKARPRQIFRWGDLAWGASAGIAGLVIGVALIGGELNQGALSNDGTGVEMASVELLDDFDSFAVEIASDQNSSQK